MTALFALLMLATGGGLAELAHHRTALTTLTRATRHRAHRLRRLVVHTGTRVKPRPAKAVAEQAAITAPTAQKALTT